MAIAAPSELLTSPEVAQLIGKSERSVLRHARSGDLPAIRVGERGHYRFRRADVERLLQPQRGAE